MLEDRIFPEQVSDSLAIIGYFGLLLLPEDPSKVVDAVEALYDRAPAPFPFHPHPEEVGQRKRAILSRWISV